MDNDLLFCYWLKCVGESSRKASTLENEDVENIKLSKRIPANRPLSDGKT